MTKTKKLVLFGTGEIGVLAHYYFSHDSPYEVVAFTSDDAYVEAPTFENLPWVPFSRLLNTYPPDQFDVHVALSFKQFSKARAEKYYAVKALGYHLPSYVCSRAVTWPDLTIGDNCFILENQTIQPTVKIGSNVMIWSGNHLGHRGVIHDHTYISSHVCIAGYVTVGPHCFLGVNATIKDFVTIGSHVFVAMAASVVKDVPDGAVVLGARGETHLADTDVARRVKKKFLDIEF